MLNLNTRVKIKGNNKTGSITGYVLNFCFESPLNMYLVCLDHGMYTQDESCFISVLVVAPDNIEVLKE